MLPIRIPSLTERREDIALLAEHFCAAACRDHGLPDLRLSIDALCAIEAAEWPGDARELAHAVEAAAIRAAADGAAQIERRHLLRVDSAPLGADGASAGSATTFAITPYKGLTFQEATRRFQVELLLAALKETGWNVTEAAAKLDLARSHAYNSSVASA